MIRRGRRWMELSVKIPSGDDRAPLLAEGLLVLGGRAIQEQDGWYVTHLPEPEDAAGFPDRVGGELAAITGLTAIEVRVHWREHEDWAETWKRGLAPRRLTDRLVVRPSWTEYEPREGDIVIVLDPGMAFGTAEHGTTRGCLRLLDRAVKRGERVLDIGAGSGILSIAAAALGAREVLAVEGDPLAGEALVENVDRNGASDAVRYLEAWTDADAVAALGPASGVVSNIEAGLLRPLVPGFREALEPGGWLVLSGILEEEWPSMRERAEDQGFTFEELDADGEWRSGLFRAR